MFPDHRANRFGQDTGHAGVRPQARGTHGLRRVIVVLPFLAIIEQNARVYREALQSLDDAGVLIEHHSAVRVRETTAPSQPRTNPRIGPGPSRPPRTGTRR